eukprot:104851-Pelagomonas_calceolata.AAC.2
MGVNPHSLVRDTCMPYFISAYGFLCVSSLQADGAQDHRLDGCSSKQAMDAHPQQILPLGTASALKTSE